MSEVKVHTIVPLASANDRLAAKDAEIERQNERYKWLEKKALDDWRAMAAEIERLTAERDALAAFKSWVHRYLDGKGVPHHPPGSHGAEGCRIGDRMDWVWAELAALRAANERLTAERDQLAATAGRLREVVGDLIYDFPDLSEIIGGQSTKAAESLIRKASAALAADAEGRP